MNQQIDKSPQAAQLSAEQRQQRVEAGAKFAPISTYIFGTLGPLIAALLVSLIMWGAYSLLGGISTNFSTAFSVTAHGFLTSLVSSPLFILILYLKPYGTADLDNPLAANLAALLPEDSAKWLLALAKSLDIFVFWTLILLAIGFAAVNPKKLKDFAAWVGPSSSPDTLSGCLFSSKFSRPTPTVGAAAVSRRRTAWSRRRFFCRLARKPPSKR